MRFEDFIVERRPIDYPIDLQKTYCACHWKEVWVAEGETLPYLCPTRAQLPAGEVGLEAAIL